jgi:protein subunit release factor B
MYTRYCERVGYKGRSDGLFGRDEAGVKSITLSIERNECLMVICKIGKRGAPAGTVISFEAKRQKAFIFCFR